MEIFSALRPSRSTALALVGLLAFTTACSSSVDQRVLDLTADETVMSPLNSLIGVDPTSGTSGADQERAAQESIADCMARAGFSYQAVALPESPSALAVSGTPTRTDIEQIGYGIAASVEFELTGDAHEALADPNEDLRAGLSEQEVIAYDTAMSGLSADEVTWSADGEPIDAQTGDVMTFEAFEEASQDGCLYQAYQPSTNNGSAKLLGSDAYQQLQQRLMSDERMQSLLAGWTQCMSAEGYSYRTSEDIYAELATEADALMGAHFNDGVSGDELGARIDDLRAHETQIAVVDFDCSAGLFELAPAINRELEVEFILDNEAIIIELLESRADA